MIGEKKKEGATTTLPFSSHENRKFGTANGYVRCICASRRTTTQLKTITLQGAQLGVE